MRNWKNTMRMYEVLTGEVVRIWAEDENQMWDKLAEGDYEFVEACTEIQFVGGIVANDTTETE